jgi:hypothetical protein
MKGEERAFSALGGVFARDRRSVVPRIRRHRRGGDRSLGDRLADFDADDVRPCLDGE